MLGCIGHQRRQRRGPPGSTLVKENDVVSFRIEKAAVVIFTPAAWAAVDKEHGNTVGITGLFYMDFMAIPNIQPVGRKTVYLWK
tara:strand:- start:64 stop:315 length:252 start_codon:yes stop_codon:yes gene_type:complete